MAIDVAAVSRALLKPVPELFHPRILALLFGPFVLALLLWALTVWLFWTPLTQAIGGWVFSGGFFSTLAGWVVNIGLPDPSSWFPAMIALMLVLPLWFVSATLLIALFAMPGVVRFLEKRAYPDVVRQGSLAVGGSAFNALSALAVFVLGYVLTMPLWFIPLCFIIVPWLWWAWFNARVMRFDSLMEHATAAERKQIIARNKANYWLIGAAVAALNFVPPLFLIAPVLGALAFAHFSLERLRQARNLSVPHE